MKKKAGRQSATRAKPAPAERGPSQPTTAEQAPELRLSVRMVEATPPYAEVSIHEPVTEHTMERLFEYGRGELARHHPRRVLLDLRDAPVKLSISDMNGLVKLIVGNFAGTVERLAIVLRPTDVPPEKFVEPSLIHRGLPSFVTSDIDDAVEWITAKLLRPR